MMEAAAEEPELVLSAMRKRRDAVGGYDSAVMKFAMSKTLCKRREGSVKLLLA